MKKYILLFSVAATIAACGNQSARESKSSIAWDAAADSASRSFVAQFWDNTEHYFLTDNHGGRDFQYWPQAHALDVLVDAYLRSGDDFYKNHFALWFDGVRKRNNDGWYNNYFDDMEWIALALLRVYDATGEAKYKDAAIELWGYIAEGWSDVAGGGIAWERDKNLHSKNACSNGPACILAARLYRTTNDDVYKDWALRIYEWEHRVLFDANTGAVSDNINGQTGAINKDWVFTYNQGTLVGSAVELHQITGEQSYLDDAVLAADYTLSTLVNDSLLKSEGTGDGGLFKGIFVRYFAELIKQENLNSADKERYFDFLKYNAETLWTRGTDKSKVIFGTIWNVRPTDGKTGLTEDTSGCMLIEAMAALGIVE
jgi:predicted alpha-1,6-mannanase (GH76 family)